MENELAKISQILELAPQEWKPLETGKLANAVYGARVKNGGIDDLKQVLRAIMAMVGVRAANLPDDAEKGLLLAHIITNYGNHTLEEIKLAFNMAIVGKLNCEVNCYENFSCAYFSQVMNAYRVWAKEEIKQIKPIAMIEEKKELTDEEMSEWIEEWRLKIENENLDLIPVSFYEYLKIYLPVDQKWQYTKLATDYRKTALYNLSVNGSSDSIKDYAIFLKMYELKEITGVEVERIKNTAKRMIVRDYLMNKLPVNNG